MGDLIWINVDDRLPELGKEVLVSNGTIYKVAHLEENTLTKDLYWDTDEDSSVFLEPTIPIHFTHWMEIPPINK